MIEEHTVKMRAMRFDAMKIKLLAVLFVLTPFLASAQTAEDVEIHGFISQGFIYTSDNNFLDNQSSDGSFEFNEIGITVLSQIDPELRLGIQLLSRDLGDLYNNEVEIDWASADYQFSEEFGIRAGILKRPLGLYNEIRDIDNLRTPVLLPQSVYDEGTRDSLVRMQGVGVYGLLEADSFGWFGYNLLFGSSSVQEDGGEARRISNVLPLDIQEFDSDRVFVASLEWLTPLDGLRLVGTANLSEIEASGVTTEAAGPFAGQGASFNFDRNDNFTGSLEYTFGETVFVFEYLLRELEGDFFTNDGQELPSPPDGISSEGYYFLATHRINDLVEVGAYYSRFVFDTNERSETETDDIALLARFDLRDDWTFKVEGHYVDGTSLLNASDNPDGFEDDFFLFLSKLSYTF